jgi:hypothetical protein
MRDRRGITLVECAVSVMVISGLLVAGLSAARTQVDMQASASDEARASLLAADMMTEIQAHHTGDPNNGLIGGLISGLLGTDVGENPTDRRTFDDVDDYDGWTETPPREMDGTVIPGYSGWTRSVQVKPVLLSNPATTSASRTGLVRITVIVTTRTGRQFSFFSLRADSMQSQYLVPQGRAATDVTFSTAGSLP